MKLLKICFVSFLLAIVFSACEVQDVWSVNDIVDGTPSKADTVLPHKFQKHASPDSLHALQSEEDILPEYKR